MSAVIKSEESDALKFLAGGGELGERMRAYDWAASPLGSPAYWPHSLKTAVRIVLTSRQPMFVWWGPQLINIYNDAYKAVMGAKHPGGLGQPADQVWQEIWSAVGPRADSCIHHDEGTYDEALQLIMERNGYREETYFTFSYSPIPNDDGSVGGIICANSEETPRIMGERQLALLRELAAHANQARTIEEACGYLSTALSTNVTDLPFAMLYLYDAATGQYRLATCAGIDRSHTAAPHVAGTDDALWPLHETHSSKRMMVVKNAAEYYAGLPTGSWTEPPDQVAVMPVAPSGDTGQSAVLVVGLNKFRLLDDSYRQFLELVCAQISASIANAQAYERESQRAEALAALDRAKSQFFSNVSHELRTPLTLMLAPMEDLLGSESLDATARETLELMWRNGERLLKLVNALLDFSRIEAGRMRASLAPVNLPQVTQDIASTFRSAFERAGLEFVIDCPPMAEPVWLDQEMWEKIVLNLLSNALKHTFDGGVRLSLFAAQGTVQLEVADTGTGIPEGELPHIFERFHRVEGARSRSHEGTGIGLALTQELVKLHHGSIHVASRIGDGTRFTVSIPVGEAGVVAPEKTKTISSTRATAFVNEAVRWLHAEVRNTDLAVTSIMAVPLPDGAARPKVLVADDNADLREYLQRLLEPRYEVTAVADGEAALNAALAQRPDVVVTDVMMPGMDGFALLHALRTDERTATVPIIMLSARAGEEARSEGMEAGADDYLVKPFSARELLARVSAHVQMAKMRREGEETLRESDRRKDEFLATLAHELRNPLAPIRNGLQIMQLAGKQQNTPLIDNVRAMMERQLTHMVRLVDDLLDVSRISRNKLELERQRLRISDVITSAVETAQPLIDAKHHKLTVSVPLEDVHVHADHVRLAQVFSNLLNNAAKYTLDHGEIRLNAYVGDSELTVSVADTGTGIPPDQLEKIFDMFAQANDSNAHSQGGLGIGLTLVKRLVEMHGGSVVARSAGRGQGSEFVVKLPIIDARSSRQSRAKVAPAATPSIRVLIADDNIDAASSLALMLELFGHRTAVANGGKETLKLTESFRPQLVLLDIGMPDIDGYETCRRLRETTAGENLPIVALTGWGQERDRQLSGEAGFDAHLTKPVDTEKLHQVLQQAAEGTLRR